MNALARHAIATDNEAMVSVCDVNIGVAGIISGVLEGTTSVVLKLESGSIVFVEVLKSSLFNRAEASRFNKDQQPICTK